MKNNLFSVFLRKPVAQQIHNQQNQILIEQTYNHTGFQQPNRALSYIKINENRNCSSEQIDQISQHNVNKKKNQSNGQIFHQKNDKKFNLQILNKDDMVYILLFCMLYMLAFFLAPNQFYHPKN